MPLYDAPPTTPGTVWRVEMLGGLRALPCDFGNNGQARPPVTQFRTHKAALLLAHLALYPHRAHGREELADMMWPDAPADRGRANLTQTLVYLRQALNEPRSGGLFVSDHRTLRIAGELLQTDVAEWEEAAAHALAATSDTGQAALLRSALAAYRGDLLPGVYDDWVCDRRNRLTALRDTLQERLQALPPEKTTESAPVREAPPVLNAPLFLTRFFGRDTEIAEAKLALCQNPPTRLLTLLGMGGIGKTRLALQIAQSALYCDHQRGEDGAPFGWAIFVPLVEAQSAANMESILLTVLQVPTGPLEGLAAVISHLNQRAARTPGRLLLLLDNLEQIGEECASVVARLLKDVPTLTILATSRQPVGVAGEQEMPLGPLDCPLVHKEGDEDEGKETVPDAVRLFVDRARLIRPRFALTTQNARTVTDLCRLLEGVPLALELAAAWMRVLTPTQIADRLQNRFALLSLHDVSSGSAAPKRHRSLHAAIAWSFDLLGPSLQTFWVSLSVFRGGWTASAAQAVTGIKDVNEPLSLLAERSLILAEADSETGEMRFRMLESLREFAQDQVRMLGQHTYAALCDRHARYFDDLSREASGMVETGLGMRSSIAMLGPERDNLRAIFARLREQAGEPEPLGGRGADTADTADTVAGVQAAIRSVLQSYWLWPVTETRQYLSLAAEATALLSEDAGAPLRAGVLSLQGLYAVYAGDYKEAEPFLLAALSLWKGIGDRKPFFTTKSRLAMLRNRMGCPEAASALWTECLQFARETNDPRREAALLNNLANVGQNLAENRAYTERAVALYRAHAPGSYVLSCSLNSLGAIAFEQRDWPAARACLEEAHSLALADGSGGTLALVKASLAELFTETGEHLDRARTLLEEAQTIFEEKEEALRIAQVLYLRFRLAIVRNDAEDAVNCACRYLAQSRQNKRDATWLAQTQADLVRQLREGGFAASADQLSAA